MTNTMGSPGASLGARPQIATLGWALRRAALGLLILSITTGVVAWLFYASIDPNESTASPLVVGEEGPQRR